MKKDGKASQAKMDSCKRLVSLKTVQKVKSTRVEKNLLYISVSVVLIVQKITAVMLALCFSRNLRTVPV